MAAREDGLQPVIGTHRRGLQLGELAALDTVAPKPIERPVPGHRHQPGAWAGGDAIAGPPLKRPHQRVLDALLGQCEIAGLSSQYAGHAARLLAKDVGQTRSYVSLTRDLHTDRSSSTLRRRPDLDHASAGPRLRHRER